MGLVTRYDDIIAARAATAALIQANKDEQNTDKRTFLQNDFDDFCGTALLADLDSAGVTITKDDTVSDATGLVYGLIIQFEYGGDNTYIDWAGRNTWRPENTFQSSAAATMPLDSYSVDDLIVRVVTELAIS